MEVLSETLKYGYIALLVALTGVVVRRWSRGGGVTARWVVLTLGVLALVATTLALVPAGATGTVATVARRGSVAGLVLFPYLLFRFVGSLSPFSRAWERVAAGLTAVGVAVTLLTPTAVLGQGAEGLAPVVLLLIQWAVLSLVASLRLWRAGRRQATVARRRLRVLSVASAGMVLTIIAAALFAGSGSLVADVLIRLSAVANALLFVVGFAPPAPLRTLWRQADQAQVDAAVVRLMGAHTAEEVTADVLGPAARLVGARAAALTDHAGRRLGVHGTGRGEPPVRLAFGFGTLDVWTSRYAPYFGQEEMAALHSLGALIDLALDRCALFAREREIREALQRSDELKNTFLSAVSHELRTPLTAILGYSTLLQRGQGLDGDRTAVFLGHVVDQARKLQRLLTDLLDLDRLTRGSMSPSLRPAELAELSAQVAAEVDFGAHHLDLDCAPVTVAVDAAKVERIVENLLTNAVRHTAPGTRICLRVAPDGDGGRIVVEDEGPGVPDELKEAIFAPFHQGAYQRDHTKGTGIGLSLVARFAELHGGRAWVEDRPGGGAAFFVHLPGAPPAPDAGRGGAADEDVMAP